MKVGAALAVVGALLLGATACARAGGDADVQSGTGSTADDGRPTLVVVGDSISEQSLDELVSVGRERGLVTHVDATSGFMTREKQRAAEAAATTHPDAAVIALGTNDAICRLTDALVSGSCRYPGFTIADMDADLTRMAQTLRQPGTCVVGVTVYFGEEVGEQLDSMVAAGLLDGIVDWRSVVNGHDSYRADGIGHLTPEGQAAFARTVVDETARICGL